MPNFFYTDASGQRQGPINDAQLQALATKKIISPQTPVTTESGHQGLAGQIPGLNFPHEQLNRQTYIILALIGGWTGVHQFYVNRNGEGIINIVLSVILFCAHFVADRSLQNYYDLQNMVKESGYAGATGGPTDSDLVLSYFCSFLFVVMLIAQITLIVRAIANNKTDGNGVTMKE